MKELFWLAALGAVLYFGYQAYQDDRLPLVGGAAEEEGESAAQRGAGGAAAVREWQNAPRNMMEMNRAVGGDGSGSSKAARKAVRENLDR